MRIRPLPPLVDFLRRAFTIGCAALVFALGLLAASPGLHRQLHLTDHSPDDRCAIVLFASGVSPAVAVAALVPPAFHWREESVPISDEIFLDSPRYLLRPERGPPVA